MYDGRAYAHILPYRLRYLNILESVRAEVQEYLRVHQSVRLHQYFHHLNSSQALAFNLFYPYLAAGGSAVRTLSAALGFPAHTDDWEFEGVPDREEGTNVDVMWRGVGGATTFCEVKLSEAEFGVAKDDPRHRKKLIEIYKPRLEALVADGLLEEKRFFRNYQLLRNLALLAGSNANRLVLLFPKENERLQSQLEEVLSDLPSSTRSRVSIAYLEDVLETLLANVSLAPRLQVHAAQLKEKYIVEGAIG